MKQIRNFSIGRQLAFASLLLYVFSCSFAQSVQKDLITGLTAKGTGIRCDEVYLSDGEVIIKRSTFVYGETFYVNFDGIEGFIKEEGYVFPDMQLLIVSETGDTAMYLTDLYAAYEEGINLSPLQLYAEVTVAAPMHSGAEYSLSININDKRGAGNYTASLDFNIVRDEGISVEGEGLSFQEIYLFSQHRGLTITDGSIGFDETIYLLFEGLEGFSVSGGQVQVGLSMLVRDADGNTILDEPDLFGDVPLSFEDVHAQLASSLVLTGTQIANPVRCQIRIWDKRSKAWIRASTELVVD